MQSFKEHALTFESFLQEQELFSRKPENLYEPCAYILSIGGKRIRPSVCLMAADMFGTVTKDALWAAATVELFHNFTLIHDDIMDQAPLRRGQVTVHEKYGTTAGILSGDVMNIMAYQCLEHVQAPFLLPLLSLFNQTAIEVCEGQQLDMDFEQKELVSEAAYIHMIGHKTAVLLACSMKIGAIVSGVNETDAALLYTFGKNLGIAFQLQDDYLDTFGNPALVGKQIGGDILANKKTFLAITALQNADTHQRTALQALAQGHSPTKVSDTISLFNALDVAASCKRAIQTYTDKANEALAAINIAPEQKVAFEELVAFLITRDY
ncbi:polyprenyl synthetase [Taibaiella sp. KBW10]|nr:polyprenyl synthetase [Taibaiella sp. KBW10]